MLQLIVILSVAFIVSPLIELASNERTQFFLKLIVYIVALVWIAFTVFIHPARL
jgi:hypothetical protein